MGKKIQIALGIALAVVTVRTAYILYERHAEEAPQVHKPAPALNADYYVTPKKLYLYDLKSAQQLTQQPVWVKLGYAYTYYPYDMERHSVNFAHEAGQLPPLEKLQIKDVITASAPGSPGRQIMAVFEKDGKADAFSIGMESDGNYHFYSDDMLFIQDPHELYKHWSAETWAAIDQHQVMPGMNELQVSFAVGLGVAEGSGGSEDKTLDYANGGKPLSVTFRNGKAVQVQKGS